MVKIKGRDIAIGEHFFVEGSLPEEWNYTYRVVGRDEDKNVGRCVSSLGRPGEYDFNLDMWYILVLDCLLS